VARRLAQNAAHRFVALVQQAIAALGSLASRSPVALARDLYALLATPEFTAQVHWSNAHLRSAVKNGGTHAQTNFARHVLPVRQKVRQSHNDAAFGKV
jgi:hypothetical protein